MALFKATSARIGWLNQPRLLNICTVFALGCAVFAMRNDAFMSSACFLFASLAYVGALVAGQRFVQGTARAFAHGQEREIVLDENGVLVRETGFTMNQGWSRFDEALESRDDFALLAWPGITVVPKRAFAAEDLVRVRNLIASKLPIRRM